MTNITVITFAFLIYLHILVTVIKMRILLYLFYIHHNAIFFPTAIIIAILKLESKCNIQIQLMYKTLKMKHEITEQMNRRSNHTENTNKGCFLFISHHIDL